MGCDALRDREGLLVGDVGIPMGDYKFLSVPPVAIMICATLVNTQTHTQTYTEKEGRETA